MENATVCVVFSQLGKIVKNLRNDQGLEDKPPNDLNHTVCMGIPYHSDNVF